MSSRPTPPQDLQESNTRPRTVWLVRDVNGAYWIENSGANRIAGGWCNEFEQVLGHELPENSRQRVRLNVEVLGEVQRTEPLPAPNDARLRVYAEAVEECENEARNAADALARAQAHAADTQLRLDAAINVRQRYIDARTGGRLREWQENAMAETHVPAHSSRLPPTPEDFNNLRETVDDLVRRIEMRDGASLTGGGL